MSCLERDLAHTGGILHTQRFRVLRKDNVPCQYVRHHHTGKRFLVLCSTSVLWATIPVQLFHRPRYIRTLQTQITIDECCVTEMNNRLFSSQSEPTPRLLLATFPCARASHAIRWQRDLDRQILYLAYAQDSLKVILTSRMQN